MILLKIILATVLSILYIAYIIEMYRHLTRPLKPLSHLSSENRIQRLIIFFIGVSLTILVAFIIRQFVLPRPFFDLIVVTLETIFIIPFFGTIFTDRLLHAWRQRRLPYPIILSTLVATLTIGLASNLLIVFGSEKTIRAIADVLSVITDLIAICFILILAFLGLGYWQSKK